MHIRETFPYSVSITLKGPIDSSVYKASAQQKAA